MTADQDEVAQLEARLDELAEVRERCRRFILVSKITNVAGLAVLLSVIFGLFRFDQVAAIGSIAVVLIGIVSLGSNVSTLRETIAEMNAAETRRSDLISRLDLRVIREDEQNPDQ